MDEQQLVRRSLSLISDGNLDAAEAAVEQVLRLNPESVPALRALAQIRSKQGQPYQTIALLKRALSYIEAVSQRSDSSGLDKDDLAYMVAQADRHAMMNRDLAPDCGEVDVPDVFASQATGIADLVDISETPHLVVNQQISGLQNAVQGPCDSAENMPLADVGIRTNPWGFLASEFLPVRNDRDLGQPELPHMADQREPPSAPENISLHDEEAAASSPISFGESSEEDAVWGPDESEFVDDFRLERASVSTARNDWTDDGAEPDFCDDVHAPDWDLYAAADALGSGNGWDDSAETYEDEYLPVGDYADYGDAHVSRAERAMQVAIQVAEDYGWDERAVHLLTEIFEQNYWSSAQVSIRREIENGLTPKELLLANEIRQMWLRRCEFWAMASFSGEIRHKYSVLSWPSTLAVLRSFRGFPQTEEVESMLDDCFEQWMESRILRLRFPAFFSFVLYRTGSKGDLSGIDGWFTFKDIPNEDSDYRGRSLAELLTEHIPLGIRKTQQAPWTATDPIHVGCEPVPCKYGGGFPLQTDRSQDGAKQEDAC